MQAGEIGSIWPSIGVVPDRSMLARTLKAGFPEPCFQGGVRKGLHAFIQPRRRNAAETLHCRDVFLVSEG
jgi:hypothetical protein